MISIIAKNGSKTISPPSGGNFSLVTSTYSRPTQISSFSDSTIKDTVTRTFVSPYVTDGQVSVLSSLPGGLPYSFQSLTPEIANIAPSGKVSFLAPGVFSCLVKTKWVTRRVDLFLTQNSGVNTRFERFTAGSLGAHVSAAVDSRILSAHDPAINSRIFSIQDHANGIYVRNPACWASDLDITCCSPWNSDGGNLQAGTLVSPIHVLFAAHFQPTIGTIIRFVTADGAVVERTLVNKVTHPDYASYFPDLCIGVLNTAVPSSIGFAKVLPNTFLSQLPNNLNNLPAIALDQEEKALIVDALSAGQIISFRYPQLPNRQALYKNIIVGDSGNPAFLIIDNQLVILNTWTYGGPGSGTFLTTFSGWINSAMTSLGGGYQLTPMDLSGFPSY